jgi:Leucine-rich repeat (LRR) protein
LETLFLSGNRLDSLGKQLFSVNATSKMYWLDFSQNKLQSQDMAFLNSANQMWSGLNYIFLSNNQLTYLNESYFHGLTNLTHLELNNNLLTHIDANTFSGLFTLQNVTLGKNPITLSDQKYVLNLCRVNGINCTIFV